MTDIENLITAEAFDDVLGHYQRSLPRDMQDHCNMATALFFTGQKDKAKKILLAQLGELISNYNDVKSNSIEITGTKILTMGSLTTTIDGTRTIIAKPGIDPERKRKMNEFYQNVKHIIFTGDKGNPYWIALEGVLDGLEYGEVGFYINTEQKLKNKGIVRMEFIPYAFSEDCLIDATNAIHEVSKAHHFFGDGHTHPNRRLFSALDLDVISLIPNSAHLLIYGTKKPSSELQGLLYYPFNFIEFTLKQVSSKEDAEFLAKCV